jgi:hypothetical protein
MCAQNGIKTYRMKIDDFIGVSSVTQACGKMLQKRHGRTTDGYGVHRP